MAARVPFKKISLQPNEVHGAELRPNSEVGDHKVSELKRFLVCRGVQCQKKNKEELVALAREAQKRNLPVDVRVDGGKWLAKKAKEVRGEDLQAVADDGDEVESSSLDLFPIGSWNKFPSRKIPPFDFSSIHNHLIETAFIENDEVDENGECYVVRFDTTKPLVKGRKYFTSGHVPREEMYDGLSHSKQYCLKGKVQASMDNRKYFVHLMIESSGQVVDASCECKASGMGRCSHVAGLMFALEDYVLNFGYEPAACTSQLCSWNQGRKEKTSKPVYMTQYTDKRDPMRTIKFNPFKEDSQPSNPHHHALKVLLEYGGPPMGWELLLSFDYEDYLITPERMGELATSVHQLQTALLFGFNQPGEVPGTTEQSHSPFWHRLRSLLITASTTDYFLAARTETIYKKIREHLWYPKSISSLAMEYGSKNESTARKAYVVKTGNTVFESGLWVNPKYPGLGASPDGLVFCQQTNTNGIVEIKCPFLLRSHAPAEFDLKLTKKQISGYFLQRVAGEVTLRKTHKYYRQIQMQMAIVGVKWCDFVVWSVKGIFIQRVAFDENTWAPICDKLLEIHCNFLCPEYFEMRIPRKLQPFCLPVLQNDTDLTGSD